MVTYPGDPEVHIELAASIAGGDVVNLTRIDFGLHSGTHVDAPVNFIDGAAGVDAIPLEVLVGPCEDVDAPDLSAESVAATPRAEERRVGKECRSGCARDGEENI